MIPFDVYPSACVQIENSISMIYTLWKFELKNNNSFSWNFKMFLNNHSQEQMNDVCYKYKMYLEFFCCFFPKCKYYWNQSDLTSSTGSVVANATAGVEEKGGVNGFDSSGERTN